MTFQVLEGTIRNVCMLYNNGDNYDISKVERSRKVGDGQIQYLPQNCKCSFINNIDNLYTIGKNYGTRQQR